jgi:hypothetical protein
VESDDKAYLSILEWPEGIDGPGAVRTVVQAAGMEPYSAELCARRGVPQVTMRVDAPVAHDILDHLHRAGVTAIAPTRAQMNAFPAPVAAKRLVPAVGAPERMYSVEPWGGRAAQAAGPVGLRMKDVFLIVRATVKRSEVRSRPDPGMPALGAGSMHIGGYGGMAGGLIGAAMRADAAMDGGGGSAVRSSGVQTTESSTSTGATTPACGSAATSSTSTF